MARKITIYIDGPFTHGQQGMALVTLDRGGSELPSHFERILTGTPDELAEHLLRDGYSVMVIDAEDASVWKGVSVEGMDIEVG